MSDSATMRPSLPTSLSEFSLPSSSSASSLPSASSSTQLSVFSGQSKDDIAPLMRRLRRPTLHGWTVSSPLAASFSLPSPRSHKDKGKEREHSHASHHHSHSSGREARRASRAERGFRDKDRMGTESSSSPSSESDRSFVPTPPLQAEGTNSRMEETSDRPKSSPMDISRSASPASALKPPLDIPDNTGTFTFPRRLSAPPKLPRLALLKTESRLDETEMKSEAQFQKILASFSGIPAGLGRSRWIDRGRYPEEAVADDEFQKEDTPSDEEEDFDFGVGESSSATYFNFKSSNESEPINITKPSTPAPSDIAESLGMRGISESPSVMDIDFPTGLASPALAAPPQQWRHTPPPTSSVSAMRTAKRKYDDRFEPYAPSAKRRAVSPSITYLREKELLVSPIVIPRSPILRPRKSFSQSQANSAASSPTISYSSSGHTFGNGTPFNGGSFSLPHNGNGHHRSGSTSSAVSSPTVRASLMLASPILRPQARLAGAFKRVGEEERIVDGTGDELKDLNIGR